MVFCCSISISMLEFLLIVYILIFIVNQLVTSTLHSSHIWQNHHYRFTEISQALPKFQCLCTKCALHKTFPNHAGIMFNAFATLYIIQIVRLVDITTVYINVANRTIILISVELQLILYSRTWKLHQEHEDMIKCSNMLG